MSTPTASVPVYFEESWAILSSIGLINVLFGLMIVGIASLSPISLVPIICSVACAVANGLCYYAFYADYAKGGTVIAAIFADISWLIQEAGLSFYSYLILIKVLKNNNRIAFMSMFWSLIAVLVVIRMFILSSRARDIINGNTKLESLVAHLHIGYFTTIALIECVSAFFLLRKFASARRSSVEVSSKTGLFSYLMRSTEIRLATLALIGSTRAVTYSFQTTAQSATTVASQVDRFVYTLECTFPVMLFIDILASKLSVTNHIHETSSSMNRTPKKSSGGRTRRSTARAESEDISMYPISTVETRVDAHGNKSSSQERIFRRVASSAGTTEGEDIDEYEAGQTALGGISKTVDFEFHVSAV